jgi:hypothetical protein
MLTTPTTHTVAPNQPHPIRLRPDHRRKEAPTFQAPGLPHYLEANMARLQILELPEGSGDDRPPFVLVVDQCVPQRIILGADAPYRDYWQDLGDKIGARGVIVTPETVDIPANDVPLDADGNPLFLKMRIEGDFEQFREQVQDEIRKAQENATRAIQDARMRAASEEGWTGRPTRPDGTPYGYSEITEGGWAACEGCRTWGQWTAENPHVCPETYIMGPIVKSVARIATSDGS